MLPRRRLPEGPSLVPAVPAASVLDSIHRASIYHDFRESCGKLGMWFAHELDGSQESLDEARQVVSVLPRRLRYIIQGLFDLPTWHPLAQTGESGQ
jgi:hypothetical protein